MRSVKSGMSERHREIFAVLNFTKETILKYGNPVGVPQEELSQWSKGLNLKEKGDTIFYTGMYSYMGYAETALLLEYTAKKEGMSIAQMLDMAKKAKYLGYKSTMKDVIKLLKSPMSSLGKLLGISSETLSKLRSIAEENDRRNEYYWGVLRKGVQVLQRSGIDIAYLGKKEPDSGVALHTFGLLEDFSEVANDVYKKLKEYGVKSIITMDPITATVFKKFYPQFVQGFDIDVKHVTEVLKPEGQKEQKDKVVYHDPCYLARYLRITEEPRNLISSFGYKVIDPPNNRLRTRCDGGGVEYTDPEAAVKTAKIRLDELLATGTNNIVTSCPACDMMFRAAGYVSNANFKLYDLVEVL